MKVMNIQHRTPNNQHPTATSLTNPSMFDVRCSVFGVAARDNNSRAFSLVELLVYIGVLMILLSVGYTAFYHSMDNSNALRRSTALTVQPAGDVRGCTNRSSSHVSARASRTTWPQMPPHATSM